MQPRILILTASYGSGHVRAASVLADEFRRAGALPTVVDHFRDLVHPKFDRWSRALYYGILRRAPALWGGAYWMGDQISVSSPFMLGFNRVGARKLRRLLRAHKFDQAVSVQPTPAAALSFLRSRGEPTPPHTTVFTDFVAHTQWIHPHVDRYCVPAEEIAHELTAMGLPREGVVVTGIPVACDFSSRPTGPPRAWRWGSRLGCPCCSSWMGPAAASAASRRRRVPSSAWSSPSRPCS